MSYPNPAISSSVGRLSYGAPFSIRWYTGKRGGRYYSRRVVVDGVPFVWEGWARFWSGDRARLERGLIGGARGGDLFPICAACGYVGGHVGGETVEDARIRPGQCSCPRESRQPLGAVVAHFIDDREPGGLCRACGNTIGEWGTWTAHAELATCTA
ncbi:MAG: hypothetical protein WC211_03825 [Dehalococcoidia bacterium]